MDVYDPNKDTWAAEKPMPTAMWNPGPVELNNRIYIFDGWDFNHEVLSPVEEFMPGLQEAVSPQGKLPTKWGEAKSHNADS